MGNSINKPSNQRIMTEMNNDADKIQYNIDFERQRDK